MTEKIISPKSTSQFSNLIYTPDLTLATVNDITILNNTSEVNTPAGYMVQAKGTITMAGIAIANETFIICGLIFTWKAVRNGSGEVTIGASSSEAVTNIVTALTADASTYITAIDGTSDTVVVTSKIWGWRGNCYSFSGASTNMSMDGAGFLGGTVNGWTNYEELESISLTGVGFPTLFTASDVFSNEVNMIAGEEVYLQYFVGLLNNTTGALIVSYTLQPLHYLMTLGGAFATLWAFKPFIGTIQTLTDGQNYSWGIRWAKFRTSTSTILGISKDRILTIQEVKR